MKYGKMEDDSGFEASNGWTLKVWSRELNVKAKKAPHEIKKIMYKCRYLQHTDGHILTSQHKAYNDFIRQSMYIELICEPIKRLDEKMFIWGDNCAIHKHQAVIDSFKLYGILTPLLPENATSKMQVLDLHWNGPVKRNIRRRRVIKIANYFKTFKKEYLLESKKVGQRDKTKLKFLPPRPTMTEGIQDLIDFMKSDNVTSTSFTDHNYELFKKVGMIPSSYTGEDGKTPIFTKWDTTLQSTDKPFAFPTLPTDTLNCWDDGPSSSEAAPQGPAIELTADEFGEIVEREPDTDNDDDDDPDADLSDDENSDDDEDEGFN